MVGLLVVAHANYGKAIIDTAYLLVGANPVSIEILQIFHDNDPDKSLSQAQKLITKLDHGNGVLVLTDLFGSTPCNIATALQLNDEIKVIAGMNLPMLIRILNYRNLGLPELIEKALHGGREGILVCDKIN